MTSSHIAAVAARAQALRALHRGPAMLVLPNVWDAASAQAVEAAGFPALATTSSGVAVALGYKDGEQAPMAEMLGAAARIIAAVSVPVTVDFEAGYRLSPREIVEHLVGVGAVGLNFEDTDHSAPAGEARLVPAEQQAERVAALKAAGRAAGVDIVVNARVDVFVRRVGTPEEQYQEGLRRARLYRDAGADCIYPIILGDEAMLAGFVQAVGTVNINVRRGGPLSLQRAAELGVRRVSYAGSIFRDTMTAAAQFVTEVKAEADGVHP
jgi:2-methylisocitrate lyase-like PEP mutase family enzyme